jgi:hypothetical protein
MNTQRTFLVLAFTAITTFCFGTNIESSPLQPGFRFKPGIYLSIEDWKHNQPIPKEAIISKYDPNDPYFFIQVLNKKWVKYRDTEGYEQEVESAKIFGYSIDNFVYTKYHTKISIIGAICHYSNIIHQIADPNLTGLAFVALDGLLAQQSGIRKKERFRQFIIDFETGKIYRFTERYFKKLIDTDVQLYNEYKSFPGRKKDKMYIFLKKYNERHPIQFASAKI